MEHITKFYSGPALECLVYSQLGGAICYNAISADVRRSISV